MTSGGALDTTVAGTFSFTVRAEDALGNATSQAVTYVVEDQANGSASSALEATTGSIGASDDQGGAPPACPRRRRLRRPSWRRRASRSRLSPSRPPLRRARSAPAPLHAARAARHARRLRRSRPSLRRPSGRRWPPMTRERIRRRRSGSSWRQMPAASCSSASTVAAAAASRWMNEETLPPSPTIGNCRLRTGASSPSLAAP